MDPKSENSSAQIDCKEMKREDLLQFSNVFASEFNSSSMHDRVLVFQTMKGQAGKRDWDVCPNMSTFDENISISSPRLARRPGYLTMNNNYWFSVRHSWNKRARKDDSDCDIGEEVEDEEKEEEEKMEEKEEEKVEEEVEKVEEEEEEEKVEEEVEKVEEEEEEEKVEEEVEKVEEEEEEEKVEEEVEKVEEEEEEEKVEEEVEKVEEEEEEEKVEEEVEKVEEEIAKVEEEEEEKVEEEVEKVEEEEKEEKKEQRGGEEEGREVNGKKGVDAVLKEDDNSENREDEGKSTDKMAFNEHKIFVHSSWLAVQSPYFRALFYSGMKESHSKEVVMKILECELQAHLTLVEAMYRLDVLNDKENNLVLEVLILANKYDVKLVFKKCKYVLMSTPWTLEKCQNIAAAVKDLPDCADILGVIEKFLVKEFTPLDKTWTMDKFTELSEASLQLLLSSNDLAVQCENTIFVALMHWIDTNYITRTARIMLTKSSLLSLVRFELMTVDFLYDVVRRHTVAEKMPGFTELLQKGLGYHGFSRGRQEQLEDKPVKRPSLADQDPSFSWVIDKSIRKRLTDSPHPVYSSLFWFQGYRIRLELAYVTDSKSLSFFLEVLNMKKDSCLDINWIAKSELFNTSIDLSEMYKTESSAWGWDEMESNISLLEVPEAVSHTIDVWVKFN